MTGGAERPWATAVVAAVALGLAAASARPYAGGWNDGSRLAAAESLIDRSTLAIDDSIFCRPHASGPFPYSADRPDLLASFEELNDLMGMQELDELEKKFAS